MTNRLYVMTESDATATGAIEHLKAIGADCLTIADNEHYLPGVNEKREVALLFVSESGRYPSNNLRILPGVRYAEEQGFAIPHLVSSVAKAWPVILVALRPKHMIHKKNLPEAIRQLHNRDSGGRGKWTGEKRKRPSRLPRLAERREERRQKHLPM